MKKYVLVLVTSLFSIFGYCQDSSIQIVCGLGSDYYENSFKSNVTITELISSLGIDVWRLPARFNCQWSIAEVNKPSDIFKMKDLVTAPIILDDSVFSVLNSTDSQLNSKLLSNSVLICMRRSSQNELVMSILDHRNTFSYVSLIPMHVIGSQMYKIFFHIKF